MLVVAAQAQRAGERRRSSVVEPLLNAGRFEELAEARIVTGDIGAHDGIVVPITNDGHLCPFMVGRLHVSLPIPTLALKSAGLRRFGKKYVFIA